MELKVEKIKEKYLEIKKFNYLFLLLINYKEARIFTGLVSLRRSVYAQLLRSIWIRSEKNVGIALRTFRSKQFIE